MHIPESYLSPATCALATMVMVPVWRKAATQMKQELTPKKIPLIGISASFSFLIMMLNIPLIGGTTGHAVGAALVAILLGPYTAVIVVSVVLLLQALLFGDGGILAFGANCLTMAFLMPFTAHFIYTSMGRILRGRFTAISAFCAGYVSLNVAALATAILFGIQPVLFHDGAGLALYAPYGLNVAIPAMMIPHLLVAGVVEGVVSAATVAYLMKVAPRVFENKEEPVGYGGLYGLLAAIILLTPLGLLAQGEAWGEWDVDTVGSLVGYIPSGMNGGFGFQAFFPDYAIAGVNEVLAYILSAVAAVLLFLSVTNLLRLRMPERQQ